MLIELTAIICAITGIAVVRTNPRRLPNQVFGVLTFLTLSFLWLVYQGANATPFNPWYPWHRANAACATLLPWGLWLLRSALIHREAPALTILLRSIPWLVFSFAWSLLCLMPDFVFLDPVTLRRTRGIPYWCYSFIGFASYSVFIADTMRLTRRLVGPIRFELQFLALNVAVTLLAGVAVTSLGNFFFLQASRKLLFVVIIVGFGITGWAIATYRIFDPRRIALVISFTAFTALLLGFAGYSVWILRDTHDAPLLDILLGLGLAGGSILWLHRKAREWLRVGDRTAVAEFRQLVIESARTEPTTERLIARFENLLSDQCKSTSATLLLETPSTYDGRKLALAKDDSGFDLLRNHGWITPEALERRRLSASTKQLRAFFEAHFLGLVLAIPVGSTAPSMIVALGTKTNGWPYTYPEIERLQNVAELMDNILTRSRLTEQAALQARVEHLAMMSRGLAHDLKNLITPVSSFLIHTEGKYDPESPEAEVHAAARRSVRIMTDYVREALFFSERLAPKFELVALSRTLSAVVEITAPRACRRGVNVATECDPSLAVVADNVLLQRMLANFATNAIDASPAGATVRLSASAAAPSPASDRILLQITDHGSGIAPEHLPRIFDAYFTTKEFGDEIRGFGLGLTIARKIADLHSATISVKSRLGEGTTITVDLPARQTIALSAPAPHCVIADTAAS